MVVVVVAIFIGAHIRDVRATTNLAVEIYEPAAENASALTLANSDMERGVSLYALGESEEDLTPFASGERQSALALESLDRLEDADADVGRMIVRVEAAREQWLEETATRQRPTARRRNEIYRRSPRYLEHDRDVRQSSVRPSDDVR